jgi:uncharacterized protein (TIGR02391 family)
MSTVPSFSDENLRSLCQILGDTSSGLTNSEIDQLLRSAKIQDPNPRMPISAPFYETLSKKDRLYAALSKRQGEDKCANNVIDFMMKVMSPVRYSDNPGRFEFLRGRLNTVLAFSGLAISEDGIFTVASPVTTLDEARRRASRLRATLLDRNIHPDVLSACRPELLEDNYFHAVLEATKSVADKIRTKSGLNLDGTPLVEAAFGSSEGKPPRLLFNSYDTSTKVNEHRGLTNLLRGIFGAFRNVTAHAPKISWPIDEEDALDLLSLASYLHRRIDGVSLSN